MQAGGYGRESERCLAGPQVADPAKRGQHDALDALVTGLKRRVSFVLDTDVRGFFDAISHGWLVKFIEHRIADKRVLRLIQKWLNARVVEDGT